MVDPQDDEKDEEWMKDFYGKEYIGPSKPSDIKDRDNNTMKKDLLVMMILRMKRIMIQMLFPQGLLVEKLKCGSQRLSL